MNVEEILCEITGRGGVITLHKGRLFVTPKEALTPELRSEMRANRPALERWAHEQIPLVRDVIGLFGGSALPLCGSETARCETIEEHAPVTLLRSCWPMRNACSEFTPDQLMGFEAGHLTADRGCGSCEIYRARHRMARLRMKREETEKREKARERANHAAHANLTQEEEEDA